MTAPDRTTVLERTTVLNRVDLALGCRWVELYGDDNQDSVLFGILFELERPLLDGKAIEEQDGEAAAWLASTNEAVVDAANQALLDTIVDALTARLVDAPASFRDHPGSAGLRRLLGAA